MNIKSNKLCLVAGLLSIFTASVCFKANASRIPIQGNVVGTWIMDCKLENHSRLVSEVVFDDNGKFDNDIAITLLEYDGSKYNYLGRERYKSNGTYEHKKDELLFSNVNITPKPQNDSFPSATTYKLKWLDMHVFKMEGIEENKSTSCEMKREYSSINR